MEYAEDDPRSPGGKARADFSWQRVRNQEKIDREKLETETKSREG